MIHPLAVVHPEATIGQNVVIEPFSVIHKDVVIGDGSWISSNVTIFDGAILGKNCKIYPGASISAVPQDLKYRGEDTKTLIGDGTSIRECVTINRGTSDKLRTEIGKNCLIMAYAHIAHDCIVGNNVILANGVQLAGHINVGDYANIGGLTAVQQFVTIGQQVYIGGCSQVRKDVPPFVKAAREPLAYAGVNKVGLERRGFTPEQIEEIREIYRLIFLRGQTKESALERIERECVPSQVRDEIVQFVRSSTIGILRGPSASGSTSE